MASDLLDPVINNLSQELETLLYEGIQAFREGEGRGNSEPVHKATQSRHEAMVSAGYCARGGLGVVIDDSYPKPQARYDTTRVVDSQLLLEVACGRLTNHDGNRYVQTGNDSYTQQFWSYYMQAINILLGETGQMPEQQGNIFGPAVQTSDNLSATPGRDGLRSGRGWY